MSGEKKKVGRPRKARPSHEFLGVMDAPMTEGNVVELLHPVAMHMKKFFGIFSATSCAAVKVRFEPNSFIIMGKDHTNKDDIYVQPIMANIGRYFCETARTFEIAVNDCGSIMLNIEKTSGQISICVHERDGKFVSQVHIADIDSATTSTYDMNIKEIEDVPLVIPDDSQYPLKFEFSFKGCKSLLSRMQKNGPDFSIEKPLDGPVQFMSSKKTITTELDVSKIKTNTLDSILIVSLTIDQLKHIFVTGAADTMLVSVHPNEPLSLDIAIMNAKNASFRVRIFSVLQTM